jgi:hypothetical protein
VYFSRFCLDIPSKPAQKSAHTVATEEGSQICRDQQVDIIAWVGQAQGHIFSAQDQPERYFCGAMEVEVRDDARFG